MKKHFYNEDFLKIINRVISYELIIKVILLVYRLYGIM